MLLFFEELNWTVNWLSFFTIHKISIYKTIGIKQCSVTIYIILFTPQRPPKGLNYNFAQIKANSFPLKTNMRDIFLLIVIQCIKLHFSASDDPTALGLELDYPQYPKIATPGGKLLLKGLIHVYEPVSVNPRHVDIE